MVNGVSTALGAQSEPGHQEPDLGASTIEVEMVAVGENAAVAIIYLNRPESLNAISWQMVRDIDEALKRAEADGSVCCVLVSGRGKGFSAGGDLKAYVHLQADPPAFNRFVRDLHDAFAQIRSMSKPVVALINGVTAAGGLELLLACDFAYAAESARIGDLHLNFGQIGGGGVLALLPRTIGPAKARELVFSARLLSSQEALEWGLVNRVFPDADLVEAGIEFARGVARRSPVAVRVSKDVLNRGFADGTGVAEALRLEADATSLYCASYPDSMEGLAAFSERRPPQFPGR